MKLINCGCSFAHGHNSKPLDYPPIQQKGLSKTGTKDSDVSAWQSAGWHLAMDYKMDYIDLARNGNSNEGILRTLRTYLHKNNKEDLFVLIGWTHAFRREYMSVVVDKNKNEFTQYREIPSSKSMLKHFVKGSGPMMVEFNERKFRPLAYETQTEYRQYNLFLQAQQMLQLYKIPYLMYNACGSEHDSNDREVLELKDQIDKDCFYQFNEFSFDQYVLKNYKYLSQDGGHPNYKGHFKLAELLKPKFDTILTKSK
tara:strand:- start:523 stop:1287 length:765 start_codon:yes stop_codon:yes gene_type:complete